MRAIFISYRREDAEGHAGRLFEDLCQHFGKTSVFMDVTGIEPGRDFRRVIEQQVAACGVLLAIVGKDWLTSADAQGRRRLDDPGDFVRLETASALKRDIPVVPVLVHGASMPRAEQLPDDLKDLAFRNSVELTHARWGSDVQLLIDALLPYVDASIDASPKAGPRGAAEPAAAAAEPDAVSAPAVLPAAPPGPPAAPGPRASNRWWLMALAAALAIGLVGIGRFASERADRAKAREAAASAAAARAESDKAATDKAATDKATADAGAAKTVALAAGKASAAAAEAVKAGTAAQPATLGRGEKPAADAAAAERLARARAGATKAPATPAWTVTAPDRPVVKPADAEPHANEQSESKGADGPRPETPPVVETPSADKGRADNVPSAKDPRIDLLGSPALPSMATRTIAIQPDTKYVNVTGGEIIRFTVGDKTFVWNFNGRPSSFDLARVAPPAVLDRKVTAYVAPNPMYPRRR